MNPQYFLILAVIIVMGWFAFGVIYNLRRGEAVLKWMRVGMPRIGERTTFRWLGTSVAELVIARAKPPFRRLETLLVLKPRDVFWLTILAAFQGREDVIIFRGQLGSPPLLDLELADPKKWSGKTALEQVTQRGWEAKPYKDMLLMAPKGLLELASTTLDKLAEPMQQLSQQYVRFGLRKETTSMEIHVPFPEVRNIEAGTYFEALRALGRAIGERS